MNIRELKEELSKFPDNARVFLECESNIELDIAGGVQRIDRMSNSVIIRTAFSYGREKEKVF